MIELTINGEAKCFESNGPYYNATEIAQEFGIASPARWRNKNSRYYENTGDLVKVNGERPTTIQNWILQKGTWMTELSLYSWAQDIDVEFHHKMVLAFRALVHGFLDEARSHALEISTVDFVCATAAIVEGTIDLQNIIRALKEAGVMPYYITSSSIFELLVSEGIIKKQLGRYIPSKTGAYLFETHLSNRIRLKVCYIYEFLEFIVDNLEE